MRWLNRLFTSSAAGLLMLAGVVLGGSEAADATEEIAPQVPAADDGNQGVSDFSYIDVDFMIEGEEGMPGPTWE